MDRLPDLSYNVMEWRPWWKRRLVSIGLTIALAVSIVLAFALILVGPAMAGHLAAWLGRTTTGNEPFGFQKSTTSAMAEGLPAKFEVVDGL